LVKRNFDVIKMHGTTIKEIVDWIDIVKTRRQRTYLTDMTKNLMIQTWRMSALMIWLMILYRAMTLLCLYFYHTIIQR